MGCVEGNTLATHVPSVGSGWLHAEGREAAACSYPLLSDGTCIAKGSSFAQPNGFTSSVDRASACGYFGPPCPHIPVEVPSAPMVSSVGAFAS